MRVTYLKDEVNGVQTFVVGRQTVHHNHPEKVHDKLAGRVAGQYTW